MRVPILTAGPIARARNGVIGCDNRLPWRLKTDMASFRSLTKGKPVIMGRKTWESLPRRPLAGRDNIVLSRNATFEVDGAVVCPSFGDAVAIGLEKAAERGASEVCVIGGASLFALALKQAQRIYLTEIDAEVEGDVVLPPIDESQWREMRREVHSASADDDHRFVIRVLERRDGPGR
jgi:dihydrofolate reductase